MEATRLMAQRFLSIKNWEKYQTQEGKRTYPWVKLYKSILTDREFLQLPIHVRYVYLGLLILASETSNKIFNDASHIAHRLSMPVSQLDLKPLYRYGFLQASKTTKWRLEKSREEKNRVDIEEIAATPPKVLVEFDTFWNQYPKKQGKDAARKAWGKLNPNHTLNTLILTRLEAHKASEQWQRENGKYIPHASTWINGKRWEDELQVKPMRLMPIQPKVVVENIQPTPAIGKHEAESILKRLGMKHLGEL
jgi:hypothetical protein